MIRRTRRLRARRGLLLVALASALPLFAVRFLPFTDAAEHVAAIATLARLLPGGGGDPGYVLALRESQYVLYDLLGAVLTRAVGDAVVANRLLLACVAVAWPFAFRSLLRALGRDERLAYFAPTLFWSRALTIGFLPFIGSVPLLFFAAATLVRQLARPTRVGAVTLASLAVLLFYAHVSTYVLLLAIGAAMAAVRARRRLSAAVATMACLLPSAACAAWWWSAASLGHQAGERVLPPSVALDAAPIWAFDLWRSHGDELWATTFWTAFVLVAVDGLRRGSTARSLRQGAFAALPFAVTAAVYQATPFQVGAAGYLDVRLAPIVVLFAVAMLRPPLHSALARAAVALGVVATLGTSATAAFEMRRIEREMLGDFQSLLDAMPGGTRLASVALETRSARTVFWPYVFAGSYHRLKPGTVAAYSFTDLAHWPIHYAPGAAPPPRVPFWAYRPCAFRHREDGAYYDFVLVQGRRDPFAEEHPGPAYDRVGVAGAFALYARRPGPEPSPDMPDRSVCRRRAENAYDSPGQ